MLREYSTDVEGGAQVCMRYVISGRLDTAGYLKFVEERANWLGLNGWAVASGQRTIALVASGPEALVGALEMACTLGPLDALVEAIEPFEEAGPVPAGFWLRS